MIILGISLFLLFNTTFRMMCLSLIVNVLNLLVSFSPFVVLIVVGQIIKYMRHL
jgi:hypothetical protein